MFYTASLYFGDDACVEEKLIQMLNVGTAQIDFFADFINSPTVLRCKSDLIAQLAKGFVAWMLAFRIMLLTILRYFQQDQFKVSFYSSFFVQVP